MDAGLLLVGAAGGLYLPSGIAMLAEMISKKHWGKAMAIHEVAPNLGLFTAPLFAEFLLRWVGWRDVLGLLGVSSIVMGVLFLLLVRGGSQKGEPPHPKAMEKVLGKPSFWIMAAVFVLLLGAEMGVYTMLPLFLVDELRFGRELANTLIGLTRGFIVVIVFFSGVIADRIGHQKAMVLFLAMTGALTLMLGVLHGPFATTALMFLQAAFLACVFPAALAVVSLIFPSDLQGLAVSFLVLIGFLLGGGAIPPGIGYLADASSFSFGFALMGILILTFQPVLLYLRPGSHLDE